MNDYRYYGEADAEHLRLLIDLRRLDLALDDAARIASWCHSGPCADTSSELPELIPERRTELPTGSRASSELEGARAAGFACLADAPALVECAKMAMLLGSALSGITVALLAFSPRR